MDAFIPFRPILAKQSSLVNEHMVQQLADFSTAFPSRQTLHNAQWVLQKSPAHSAPAAWWSVLLHHIRFFH